ncbi:DnaJ C-terminal domain-containing protein [Trinickia dinghuensis]|uniref:J domain-containing protein n=1 Tax=Trinickia dinghuensis TaxID=2291023 RepID=A0A3D8K184_9BURK|nr:DnaJ C-terminal domain-containing protein [Trinickia dinghuensis]RDU99009.1 J domain-containing protein [Trinickia dinghuensis]
MSLDEYYRRLELPATASPADVKRAYRRLRAKYHPDRNKGREASVEPAFKRIQEAFEILIGERQAPISTKPAPEPAPAPTPEPKRGPARGPTWEWAWGSAANSESERPEPPEPPPRSHRSGPPMRGANCMTELFVPLEAAIHGGEVEVSYGVRASCSQCHGHARGRCTTCFGKGFVAYNRHEKVSVAPGAWDGQRVVVDGAGNPGANGGPAGDAIFSVVIVCSSAFRRDGLNVACDIEVDFVTAMLGGSHEAKVLDQTLPIVIEPNSGPGTVIRLRGSGLSGHNGARGDLMLHVALVMPAAAAHLTEEERHRLREMFAAAQRRANVNR